MEFISSCWTPISGRGLALPAREQEENRLQDTARPEICQQSSRSIPRKSTGGELLDVARRLIGFYVCPSNFPVVRREH